MSTRPSIDIRVLPSWLEVIPSVVLVASSVAHWIAFFAAIFSWCFAHVYESGIVSIAAARALAWSVECLTISSMAPETPQHEAHIAGTAGPCQQ